MAKKDEDIDLTYGEAMHELHEIMEAMESDELEVDMLMVKVKRAAILIKYCKDSLLKVNKEIQKVLDDIE